MQRKKEIKEIKKDAMHIIVEKLPNESIHTNLNDWKKELNKLFKQKEQIDKKIITIREKELIFQDELDRRIISSFHKDYKFLTKEEWVYILTPENGQYRYNYSTNFLYSLGFSSSGYHQVTNQRCLFIYRSEEKTLLKLISIFKYIRPHLMSCEVKDNMRGNTEKGVPIFVMGLDEDCNSVIYIKTGGSVHLYKSRYSEVQKFKNFEDFIYWLIGAYKIIKN